MKTILLIVGGFALFLAVIFALNLFGFLNYSFFAPKIVAVQNKTFQESQQYNEGMVRDLENIRMEYLRTSDPGQKAALRAIAIHRFEVYPQERLPPDLQDFYRSIQ